MSGTTPITTSIGDVDEHAELNDPGQPQLIRVEDDDAAEQRRDRVADPRDQADDRIPAEADSRARHAERAIEQALPDAERLNAAMRRS